VQRIQLIASAATVVPFVGIVELGRVLLADRPLNNARVWTIVAVVVGALLVRTLASGTALTITPPFLYISRYMRGRAATPGRRWRDGPRRRTLPGPRRRSRSFDYWTAYPGYGLTPTTQTRHEASYSANHPLCLCGGILSFDV
jgi:hypothetical protein